MILSGQCACGQKVEFEAEDLPQLTCPTCGRSLHEQFAPPKPPQPPRFEPPKTSPSPEFSSLDRKPAPLAPTATQKTLNVVRAGSCYKTLRGLIQTVISVALGLVVLAGAATLLMMAFREWQNEMIAGGAAVIFICVIAAVLLIALKQALLLGIDAVDVLIADRTDRQAEQTARRQNAAAEFTAGVDK